MPKRRVLIDPDAAAKGPRTKRNKGAGTKKQTSSIRRARLGKGVPARCVACGHVVRSRRVREQPSYSKPCPKCGGRRFTALDRTVPETEAHTSGRLTAPNPRRVPGSFGSRGGG